MIREQISAKFGNCKYADSGCNGSYENTSELAFYVYDPPSEDNQPVKLINDKSDKCQLHVNNPGNKDICLVKTDRCLFTSSVSKCDCLLFDNTKFYFVEIKNTNSGGRKASRNKAIAQLGSTIDLLKNNDIDLSNVDLHAIVCFKTMNSRPIQSATTKKQADFFEQYSIVLKEINEIEF